jgi:hypothetical protein
MRDDLRLLFAFFYVRIKVFQASHIKGVLAFGHTSHTAPFNFETDFLYKRYVLIELFKTTDAEKRLIYPRSASVLALLLFLPPLGTDSS